MIETSEFAKMRGNKNFIGYIEIPAFLKFVTCNSIRWFRLQIVRGNVNLIVGESFRDQDDPRC